MFPYDILPGIDLYVIFLSLAAFSAIISFGGNPRFNNSQGSFWNTRNVCYLTSPSQFLNCNIQRERRAINKIERVILQTQNQSLHLLLQEIIADKNSNITLLNSILSSL